MKRNVIETLMGAVVLAVAALFLAFVYSSSDVRATDGYELVARFNRVDGLATGSEVRLSGIKIGSVVSQRLDPATYLAEVRISVTDTIRIPVDSTARIISDGLLGDLYLSVEPGADDAMLEPGAEIRRTQDPLILADMIGHLIFGAEDEGQ